MQSLEFVCSPLFIFALPEKNPFLLKLQLSFILSMAEFEIIFLFSCFSISQINLFDQLFSLNLVEVVLMHSILELFLKTFGGFLSIQGISAHCLELHVFLLERGFRVLNFLLAFCKLWFQVLYETLCVLEVLCECPFFVRGRFNVSWSHVWVLSSVSLCTHVLLFDILLNLVVTCLIGERLLIKGTWLC